MGKVVPGWYLPFLINMIIATSWSVPVLQGNGVVEGQTDHVKPVVNFLHLPKCGGSSVGMFLHRIALAGNLTLKRAYYVAPCKGELGELHTSTNNGWCHFNGLKQYIGQSLEDVDIFSGHQFDGYTFSNFTSRPVWYTCLFRNPLDRAVSGAAYLARVHGVKNQVHSKDYCPHDSNTMYELLRKHFGSQALPDADSTPLVNIVRRCRKLFSEKFVVLGLADSVTDSAKFFRRLQLVIRQIFGLNVSNYDESADLHVPLENVNNQVQGSYEKILSASCVENFRNRNQIDYELWKLVKELSLNS